MTPASGKVTSGVSAAWMMVLATVLFALMGVCVKQASSQVTTAEVVFFRGLVGAVLIGLCGVPLLPGVFNFAVRKLTAKVQAVESYRLPPLRIGTLSAGLVASGVGWCWESVPKKKWKPSWRELLPALST